MLSQSDSSQPSYWTTQGEAVVYTVLGVRMICEPFLMSIPSHHCSPLTVQAGHGKSKAKVRPKKPLAVLSWICGCFRLKLHHDLIREVIRSEFLRTTETGER